MSENHDSHSDPAGFTLTASVWPEAAEQQPALTENGELVDSLAHASRTCKPCGYTLSCRPCSHTRKGNLCITRHGISRCHHPDHRLYVRRGKKERQEVRSLKELDDGLVTSLNQAYHTLRSRAEQSDGNMEDRKHIAALYRRFIQAANDISETTRGSDCDGTDGELEELSGELSNLLAGETSIADAVKEFDKMYGSELCESWELVSDTKTDLSIEDAIWMLCSL